MRHFGRASLRRVLPNLPETARKKVERLLDNGWNCAFYLGVYHHKMLLCLAAKKDKCEHIVLAEEPEQLADQLFAQVEPHCS